MFLLCFFPYNIITICVCHQSSMEDRDHIVSPCCSLLICNYAPSPFLPNFFDWNPLCHKRASGGENEKRVEGRGVVALHWTHLSNVFPAAEHDVAPWLDRLHYGNPLCCSFIELDHIHSTPRASRASKLH